MIDNYENIREKGNTVTLVTFQNIKYSLKKHELISKNFMIWCKFTV